MREERKVRGRREGERELDLDLDLIRERSASWGSIAVPEMVSKQTLPVIVLHYQLGIIEDNSYLVRSRFSRDRERRRPSFLYLEQE